MRRENSGPGGCDGAIDGIGGVDLATVLLDLAADPPPDPVPIYDDGDDHIIPDQSIFDAVIGETAPRNHFRAEEDTKV